MTNQIAIPLTGSERLPLAAPIAPRARLLPLVAICALLPSPIRAQATFTGLGFFGGYESRATDISADGRVVVGFSNPNLFRWTGDTSIVRPALQQARPAVSADGSVVVGAVLTPEDAFEGFRWTVGESFTMLGDFPGGFPYPISRVFDVSADGRTVVGHGTTSAGDQAFRWTPQTGLVNLGDLTGGDTASRAHGVSADGSVIVGYGTGASNRPRAVRWTVQSGLEALRDPSNVLQSEANAVSANGAVIVGVADFEAFRWTAGTGVVPLGDLLGGRGGSVAHDVNADGSVIVGSSDALRDDGHGTRAAFYWTAQAGMVNLRDLLISNGATNLAGWRLSEARGVSADGLTIVGTGLHDGRIEAFVATIPEPATIILAALAAAAFLAFALRKTRPLQNSSPRAGESRNLKPRT
jgi:probable HAF family extracellular repeat protein